MRKIALFAIAGAGLLASCNQGPAAPEKTVQQLMKEDVQPTAQSYWDAVQFVSDETGEHDIFPQTDADWAKTKAAATKLRELADLLKTAAYTEGRNEDWTTFANSMGEVAAQMEQAAEQQDKDKVFEVGGTMYNVCSACHMVYPATTGPEATGTPAA